MSQHVVSRSFLPASRTPLAPAELAKQHTSLSSPVPGVAVLQPASYLPLASSPTQYQQSRLATHHAVQQHVLQHSSLPSGVAPRIEMQLLNYLSASLSSHTMLSEAHVQQLVSSAGTRVLELNIRLNEDDDEGSWPLLHLVVLNTATPAPALERIIEKLIQLGAAPETLDEDGDSALVCLLALAEEHREDGDALPEEILAAQAGAIVALLHSSTLKVSRKEAEQVCSWLRHFGPSEGNARQRVLDALGKHVEDHEVAGLWCSEELLAYLDSYAYDGKRSVEALRVLSFLNKGASPRHSQNGATALMITILNPYNRYEELRSVFRAMLQKDPECVTIKDGFKLLPFQWAADYRNVSSQHNLLQPNPASLLAFLPTAVETLPADVDAGEVCLKALPSESRCSQVNTTLRKELRFKEGDLVRCRVQLPGGEFAWEEGVVVDVWYREECWPDDHPGAPYEVLLSIGTRVFALADHDRIIRNPTGNQDVIRSSSAGVKNKRFQRVQKNDGSWEILDTVSGKRRPVPSDSEDLCGD